LARRLMLDTAVLVTAERETTTLDELLQDDDDVAIAAVTAAELLAGIKLADASRHAARSALSRTCWPQSRSRITTSRSRAHAGLLAHVCRTGKPRGAHDLIIAATALVTGRTAVTSDLPGFQQLPGVTVLDLHEAPTTEPDQP
jgi:tRNA(fMet)-specific endonuclease VapC